VGRIAGAHGIKGWVKIVSDTEPAESILAYQPWLLGPDRIEVRVQQGSSGGKWVLAAIDGITDRAAAEALAGQDIAVRRAQFPELPRGRYYWSDLLGCSVVTVAGVELGTVRDMIETGANDVMLVRGERERLIPFVMGHYVCSVDLDAKRIEVDWDPDF
jgi:16S rRNA processing protein RimM